MGDLTTLHTHAKRLVFTLKEGLEKLEGAENGSVPGIGSANTTSLYLDLRSKLHDLQVISSDMESLWRMFVIRENASKRALWKGKVEQVVEEVAAMRNTLDKYGTREQRRLAELADREELFSRAKAPGARTGVLDDENQLRGSFMRSKRALEEIYETGSNILTNMASNKERLKKIQRKTLDVLNSVGLGETMLRMIERRQRADIWFTYGGMVVVTIIVLVVIWAAWR